MLKNFEYKNITAFLKAIVSDFKIILNKIYSNINIKLKEKKNTNNINSNFFEDKIVFKINDIIFMLTVLVFTYNLFVATPIINLIFLNPKETFIFLNLFLGGLFTLCFLFLIKDCNLIFFFILTVAFNLIFKIMCSTEIIFMWKGNNPFSINTQLQWFNKNYGFWNIIPQLKLFFYFNTENKLLLQNLNDDLCHFNIKKPFKTLNEMVKTNFSIQEVLTQLEEKKIINSTHFSSGICVHNQINIAFISFKNAYLNAICISFFYCSKILLLFFFLIKIFKKYFKLFQIKLNFFYKSLKIFVITGLFILNITPNIIFWMTSTAYGECYAKNTLVLLVFLWYLNLVIEVPKLFIIWLVLSPFLFRNYWWQVCAWDFNYISSDIFYVKDVENLFLKKSERTVNFLDKIMTRNLKSIFDGIRVMVYQIFLNTDYFLYRASQSQEVFVYRNFEKYHNLSDFLKFTINFLNKKIVFFEKFYIIFNYLSFFAFLFTMYNKYNIFIIIKTIKKYFLRIVEEIRSL